MKKGKKSCPHCGNNPTNHKMHYIGQTVSVLMSPFDHFFMNTFLGYALRRSFNFMCESTLPFLSLLRLASFHQNINLSPCGRGKVIWEEAIKRGIRMEGVIVFGKPLDIYRAKYPGGKKMAFVSLPRKETRRIETRIDDKAFLKKKLQAAKIPVARGAGAVGLREALRLFASLEKPVIVKPQGGSRGRHTTTSIYTKTDFIKAWRVAKQLGRFVIVEEHLKGSVYRGTLVGGKLVGALRGDPARVIGDGKKSISQLIETKNKNRHERVSEIKITPLLESFIARAGYTTESILPKGTVIDLSEKIGIGYGGHSKEMLEEIHPEIRETLERAATVLNDDILGFDFIIEDPTKDPDGKKWGIIECNTVPFIDLHHFPLEGKPQNVAKYVWDLLERSGI